MTEVKSISPITANEWLSNNEAILIDVREPFEYVEIHITGAHLIPLNTIEINMFPVDAKIIIHCKFGERGSIACEKLLLENPNLDVYNLDGGIIAWENAGLKCNKKYF